MHLSSHSFIHPSIHSFIQLFIHFHLSIHLSIHSLIQPFMHPSIQRSIHSSIHSFIQPFIFSVYFSDPARGQISPRSVSHLQQPETRRDQRYQCDTGGECGGDATNHGAGETGCRRLPPAGGVHLLLRHDEDWSTETGRNTAER